MLTRWLASVGVVNLVFLAEWRDVNEVYSHNVSYFTAEPFPLTYAGGIAMAVVVLGTALAAASRLVVPLLRRLSAPLRNHLMVLATALGSIVVWLGATPGLVSFDARVAGSVFIIGGGLFFSLQLPPAWLRRLVPQLLAASVMLLPVFVVTAVAMHQTYPDFASPAPTRSASAASGERVVWIVFDELESAFVTSDRPAGVALEAFDRLRAEALEATRAHAPGGWTIDAMPTLWTGHPVAEARETGPASLIVRFAGDPETRAFDPASSVFARAQRAGAKVGVAGWHHPYCRLFAAYLTTCLAEANESANFAVRRARVLLEEGYGSAVLRLLDWHSPRSLEELARGGPPASRLAREDKYARERHGLTYRRVHDRALAMVRDPGLSLAFVHYPIPHLPRVGVPRTSAHGPSADGEYFDNLLLFDQTLMELRAAMESAGEWRRTTVVVHSDHALRPSLWKSLGTWGPALQIATGDEQGKLTPFVVKLAGAPEARIEFDAPFSAALTGELVLAALDGRFRQLADLATWLEANRDRVPLDWPVTSPWER